MAKNNKLTKVAVMIGSTMGRVDGTVHKAVHKITRALDIAKDELVVLTRQMDDLKRELVRGTHRLRAAF